MRGLIANTSGRTIEVPIRANYREGLNAVSYTHLDVYKRQDFPGWKELSVKE